MAGAIIRYAEEHNVNLIVVGTRGRSAFTKLLLGSVASAVVTYAHCPGLVNKVVKSHTAHWPGLNFCSTC